MTDDEFKVLERDALRYRWLRDQSNGAPDHTPTVYSWRRAGRILHGPDLDAAIDAALSPTLNEQGSDGGGKGVDRG